jgi:hypothetical protein
VGQWLKLSEIWQLLPKHSIHGFVWSTLKDVDFSFTNGCWVIPVGTSAKDIQALSVVESAKGRFLPLYRSLIVDARHALESEEIEAEGCKSALDAPRIKIDPDFWAHADFYTAPLHKCTIDFAGVRWYRIRVRRRVALVEMGSSATQHRVTKPLSEAQGGGRPAGLTLPLQTAKNLLFQWLNHEGVHPVTLGKGNHYTTADLKKKIYELLSDDGMPAKLQPSDSRLAALIPQWIAEYNKQVPS